MEKKNRRDFTAVTDERGEIIDLLVGESINAVTLVTFKKGAVRGNHVHKETTQWNYVVSGRLRYVSQLPGQKPSEVELGPHDFSVSRPGESHAFTALEEPSELLVFTRGPRSGKEYETDTFRLTTPLIKR